MKPEINVIHEREDKLTITIDLPHTKTREFTVLVDEDGIKVIGDDALCVVPIATNTVRVDYL